MTPELFRERNFGSAMLRSASVRVFLRRRAGRTFSPGPRYYRDRPVAASSIAVCFPPGQALIRRGDMEYDQFNYFRDGGRAAAAALVVTYYSQPSVTARCRLTFVTSIATDAGGNLVLEFLPTLSQVSIMQKLRLE